MSDFDFNSGDAYTPPAGDEVSFQFVIPVQGNVAEDIKSILNDAGFGVAGVDLFAHGIEPTAKNQLVIIASDGIPSDIPATVTDHAFQVLSLGCKDETPNIAYATAMRALDYLSNLCGVTINGSCYSRFITDSTIGFIGLDENERPVWSGNYTCFRSKSNDL